MGCCGKGSVKNEEEPYGPVADRKCRDVIFLLLFILFWGGMIAIAVLTYQSANTSLLLHGYDKQGNICGYNNTLRQDLVVTAAGTTANYTLLDMTYKPFVFWVLPIDIAVQKFDFYRICVSSCPQGVANETTFVDGQIVLTYKTQNVLNRCLPLELPGSINTTILNQNVAIDNQSISLVMNDFISGWKWMAVGLAVAVVLGFVWIVLMRFCAGVIVWITIVVTYLLLLGVTACAWYFAKGNEISAWASQTIPNADGKIPQVGTVVETYAPNFVKSYLYNSQAWLGAAIVLSVICLILLILLIWMRNRIRLAVAILKEAAKAVAAMPSLFLFPLFPMFWMAGFMGYWIGVGFLLASSEKPQYFENGLFDAFYADEVLQGFEIYHFFGLLWTTQFIVAVSQTTIAGAVSYWYWVHDKKQVPWVPSAKACWTVFRYHLGSMAFGSLIIAIVQFIRAILAWLQKRLNGATSRPIKALLTALQCCMACFERFLKFINKNAYIMIAVKGDSFCVSAQRAFQLIFANILRVGTVGVVSTFLMFLGKVFVTSGACIVSGWLLWRDTSLAFWFIPCLVVGVLAFLIATLMMSVFDMAIDTILLSFCEDSERNDGKTKPYFMSKDLQTFVDNSGITAKCC